MATNPLYSEFKRKFSLSMYKNMGISLGEMTFLKDFRYIGCAVEGATATSTALKQKNKL